MTTRAAAIEELFAPTASATGRLRANDPACAPKWAPAGGANGNPIPEVTPFPCDLARLLRVRDLAAVFRVSERTIRTWRSEGKLPPALEIDNVVRWRLETITRWLEERERRA